MTKKEFLIIAIATFITIVAWVVFDILHTRAAVEISAETQQIIEPIDPNFNLEGLND